MVVANSGLLIPPSPYLRTFDVLRRDGEISVWVGLVRAKDLTQANTKAYMVFGSRCYAREQEAIA